MLAGMQHWVLQWWRWSTGPGIGRKLAGIVAPLLAVTLAAAALLATGPEAEPADLTSQQSQPESRPGSGDNGAISGYALDVLLITSLYRGEMIAFSDQDALLRLNPMLVYEDYWTDATGTAVGRMRVYNLQLRALQPPQCLQSAHASLTAATNAQDEALDLYMEGIIYREVRSLDSAQMIDAVARLDRGAADLQDAAREIQETTC